MLTPGTIVPDVSQPSRATANRASAGRSGEFGEALSSVASDERPSREDYRTSAPEDSNDDDESIDSAGSRTNSRLALSFLQKNGDAAAQSRADGGQPATSTTSLAGLKTAGESLLAKGSDLQPAIKTGALPEATLEASADAGKLENAHASKSPSRISVRDQNAGGDGMPDLTGAQGALSSDARSANRLSGTFAQDGKTVKMSSSDRKSRNGEETDLSKPGGLDAQAALGQAADASAGRDAPAQIRAATDGDAQTSAQAVATLLSGLAPAEAAPQPKPVARGETVPARAEKESKLSLESVLGDSDLLDAMIAKDGLSKNILEQTVATAETEKRSFRLTSATGGRSLEMTIGTDQSGKATFDTATKTSGAETVTVLDSRRFLGFTQTTNASALTSAISGDSEWQKAMQPGATLPNEMARPGTHNVVNTLKLQMTPIDLGMVTATLRLVGEELSVHLTVETRAAHQQLSDDSSGILGALRAQGFSVDQVTVTMASPDQNAQMSNDGQQRSMDTNGQQGSSQSQGQSSGRSEASVKYGTNEADAALETRTPSSDGAGGTSDIYL